VSVVSSQARRRWSLVAGGVAVLCALPALHGVFPVGGPHVSPAALHARILASASLPYAGYAESNATFGLPPLAGFTSVTSLLDGVTRMRVWQASANSWRVDVLSDIGEVDTYQTPGSSYIWDSRSELLTEVFGRYPVRLPRAADLVPPALAIRLLRAAGQQARFSGLPARRIAGLTAVGLRVTPADPASTVGQIDIWAEPGSGLPLQVEIFGRGAARPALVSQFLQVKPWHPDRAVLTPQSGPGTAFTVADAADLVGALSNLGPVLLPDRLAGRPRVPPPAGFGEVGIYGRGLATFAVLQLSGSGAQLIHDAELDGGSALSLPGATGVLVSTPLVTTILMRAQRAAGTFVLTGLVVGRVLEQAATTLASGSW
jgi:hypothetical protein